MSYLKWNLLLFCLLLLAGCPSSPEVSAPSPVSTMRGDNSKLLGLAVAPSAQEYTAALNDSVRAGSQVFEISQQWKEFESSENQALLPQLRSLMKAHGLKVVLTLNALDTLEKQIPAELEELPYNDPRFLQAYLDFAKAALSKLPDIELASIGLGNEVDILLGDSEEAWEQYTEFFIAAHKELKKIKPEVPIGVKVTFEGFQQYPERVRKLMSHGDLIMITYYPLTGDTATSPDAVFEDFQTLSQAFEGKRLQINEIGYPSSSKLGSSEEKQAAFVSNVFEAWKKHPQIELLNFVWLNDMTPRDLQALEEALGQNSNLLLFLSTLGLRDSHGQPKAAFESFLQRDSID